MYTHIRTHVQWPPYLRIADMSITQLNSMVSASALCCSRVNDVLQCTRASRHMAPFWRQLSSLANISYFYMSYCARTLIHSSVVVAIAGCLIVPRSLFLYNTALKYFLWENSASGPPLSWFSRCPANTRDNHERPGRKRCNSYSKTLFI